MPETVWLAIHRASNITCAVAISRELAEHEVDMMRPYWAGDFIYVEMPLTVDSPVTA